MFSLQPVLFSFLSRRGSVFHAPTQDLPYLNLSQIIIQQYSPIAHTHTAPRHPLPLLLVPRRQGRGGCRQIVLPTPHLLIPSLSQLLSPISPIKNFTHPTPAHVMNIVTITKPRGWGLARSFYFYPTPFYIRASSLWGLGRAASGPVGTISPGKLCVGMCREVGFEIRSKYKIQPHTHSSRRHTQTA